MVFRSIGRFSYRYRYFVIAFWALLLAASLPFAAKTSSVLVTGGFNDPDSESFKASEINREVLEGGRSVLILVFQHPEWRADDPRFIKAEREALRKLEGFEGVKTVATYEKSRDRGVISKDGRTTYASIEFVGDSDEVKRSLPEIRDRIEQGPLKTWLTGDPAVYADIEEVSQKDLADAERAAIPLSLIVLLLVYGSVVAAGMPIIIGFVSVLVTLAAIYLLAQGLEMSIFVLNMASMLGLAIGIDYSLLMVSRFREELGKTIPRVTEAAEGEAITAVRKREAVGEAIAESVGTAGRSIAFSGLAVFIGLSGMLIFPFMNLRSMGIGGQVVVIFSVAASLTLLPALLGIVGNRINSLSLAGALRRLRPSRRGVEQQAPAAPGATAEGEVWRRIAAVVMRFPVSFVIGVTLFIFVLASPALNIIVSVPDAKVLPKGVESREGAEILDEKFGRSHLNPVFIVIRTEGDALSKENVARVFEYSEKIKVVNGVESVLSYTTLVPRFKSVEEYQALYSGPEAALPQEIRPTLERSTRENVTVVQATLKAESPISAEANDTVVEIRKIRFDEGEAFVGGFTAGTMDYVKRLYDVFPYAILLVAVLTYFVLMILFRSVILPLKAVLMNSLSILASFGIMVFIFQEGNLNELLNFSTPGNIDSTLPIVMFCTLFGISMDYEIFLLTRIKEAYDETGDNSYAVSLGLVRTGRIITSAALVVVIVTGSFALTDIIFIKALGVGLAVAILIDATIVRALLVPATMKLLGKWNWWAPKWLQSPKNHVKG